ncbi:MAG: AsmA family protein, partial [Alphaproteobacteria bacterium]|nr:AsmA family protein [Alphaproteobacteria bacterium]
LAFDGTVTLAAALKAGGALDLKVPSIRELAAWAGNPLPKDAGGSGLGPLAIKGKVAVDGQKYSFTDASLAIDAIKGTGAFAVDLSKGKPYANAKLDIEMLDVNPYLPKQQGKPAAAPASGGAASSGTAGGATPPGGATAGAGAKPSDWSDDPIDASGLRAADADLALTVGGIRYQEIKIGKSALDVALKAGRMTADLKELALYDGKATAKIALDGAGPELGLQQSFALQGVKALPLLKDAAGFDRLDGNANGQVAVTSRGRTQRQIVQNLNGSGDLKFLNGAIIGINLAAMVRNVATAFLDSAAKETQKTDFAELGGTFKITNGILRNDDLFMAAPLVRVSGKGTSDLPKRTVDYRIEPKAVASTTGQGGQQQSGIAVPVNVKGPWHALSYQPDLGAALGIDAAGNLISGGAKGIGDAAKGAVQDITKGVQKPGDLLKGVLQGGGGSQQPAAGGQQPPQQQKGSGLPDPGKALKGLFGN